MSSNLSCLIGCSLNKEQLINIPNIISKLSEDFFCEKWKWHESDPSKPWGNNNLESLIESGFIWLSCPIHWTIIPRKNSITIDYGLSYSRLFSDGESVDLYIKFCVRTAKYFGCKTIFFIPDTLSESMNYATVCEKVRCGELLVSDIDYRLSEAYDADVYIKTVLDT